jgi:hypothetical protein
MLPILNYNDKRQLHLISRGHADVSRNESDAEHDLLVTLI